MSSCLNFEVLDELVDIMGDDMGMLIDSYIEDTEAKLEQLFKMTLNTEQEAIFRMAHSLKGSSRNVGVQLFADYCEVMETNAREEGLTVQDFNQTDLQNLFNSAKKELQQRYLKG